MKISKKIQKRYDRRIHAYKYDKDGRVNTSDDLKGYTMPGSRNPKKLCTR